MDNTNVMGLKDEDIALMQDIDAKANGANATVRVALDHHAATMAHLAGEREAFWNELRERFGLDPNAQFSLQRKEGFWQLILTPVDVPEVPEAANEQ